MSDEWPGRKPSEASPRDPAGPGTVKQRERRSLIKSMDGRFTGSDFYVTVRMTRGIIWSIVLTTDENIYYLCPNKTTRGQRRRSRLLISRAGSGFITRRRSRLALASHSTVNVYGDESVITKEGGRGAASCKYLATTRVYFVRREQYGQKRQREICGISLIMEQDEIQP